MKRLGLIPVFFTILVGSAFGGHGGSLIQQSPADAQTKINPFEGDEKASRAGAKLFSRECSACHGKMGAGGGKAPPLKSDELAEAPAGSVFWVLRNGSTGRGMPSFANLPETRRWQIVTFLKTLQTKQALPSK